MEINLKLKSHRQAKKLTQEEVAEKLYVSRATISSWETGRIFPDIEKLILLSDLYGMSLDQLIKEEPMVMKKIVSDRKKVTKYKYLKRTGIVLLGIFIIYNVYWFIEVAPKNKKLADWEHTANNNYLEKGEYSFQAHDLKYPMFLPNNNLSVSTYRSPIFQIDIDGKYAYVTVKDPTIMSKQNNPLIGFIKFDRKKGLTSAVKVYGELTVDEVMKKIESDKSEFDKVYNATEDVWKEINN